MTLIQTLITDDLIIQVADRRLTNAATGMLVDDQYTKVVCWNFNFSIGFTGLARIDRAQRKSTSESIAETICDYGLFEAGVAALARVASERVDTLPKAWPDKRLGILVAGFDGHTDPLVAEIANFEAGGPMPGDSTNFTVKRVSRLQRVRSAGHPGQVVGADQRLWAETRIDRVVHDAHTEAGH